jgi:hypothetical protein
MFDEDTNRPDPTSLHRPLDDLMARFRFFGGKTESFQVFWDLEEAQQWLDAR